MGIGKNHALGRQLIHVRRTGLGIALQRIRPVIQIIDGDEKDVRPMRGRSWFVVFCSLLRLCRVRVRRHRTKKQNGQGEDRGLFHWCINP